MASITIEQQQALAYYQSTLEDMPAEYFNAASVRFMVHNFGVPDSEAEYMLSSAGMLRMHSDNSHMHPLI